MKVKVFYQDFKLNSRGQQHIDMVMKPEEAVEIREITVEEVSKVVGIPVESIKDKEIMVNGVWRIMNDLDIPPGHPDRHLFEKAGHTSMSVGDYVVFEDGEIWQAKIFGWKIICPKKITTSVKNAIHNAQKNIKKANKIIEDIESGKRNLTPCKYPMSKFYNYEEEIPEGTRVCDPEVDCKNCDYKDCEEEFCLITD
jgi:hypothetical protein